MEMLRTMLLCIVRFWAEVEKGLKAEFFFICSLWFLMFFLQRLCLVAVEVSLTSFLYIFLLLLLLKEHIMFYHSRLQYSFLLCYFHSILCPLFLFPYFKVPKLNEQEDKFLQEVFIIIILKCLKLGLVKI